MGYPLDLDEMDEDRLRAELDRREQLRARGLCDYCARPPDSAPCKLEDRHAGGAPPTHLSFRLSLDEAPRLRKLLRANQADPAFSPLVTVLLRQLGT